MPRQLVSLILGSLFLVVGAPSLTPAWGADFDALELAGRWVTKGQISENYYDLSPTGSKSFRLTYQYSRFSIPDVSSSGNVIKITASIRERRITGEKYALPDFSGSNCRHPGITIPITGIISEDGRRIVIIVPKHRGVFPHNCVWGDMNEFIETFYRE